MRFFTPFRVLLAACLLIALSATVFMAQTKAPAAAPASADQVARGKYLVTIQDCNGCHTHRQTSWCRPRHHASDAVEDVFECDRCGSQGDFCVSENGSSD